MDIRARGFWNNSHDAFFNVRVFYPNASSNHSTVVSSAYRRHEQAKKREYGQRVRDVEHGLFTPLVLSSNGGMGKEATTFYKRLADMIAQKRQHPYSMVMGGLRCRLSFASLRSCIMCIRGEHHQSCCVTISLLQVQLHPLPGRNMYTNFCAITISVVTVSQLNTSCIALLCVTNRGQHFH